MIQKRSLFEFINKFRYDYHQFIIILHLMLGILPEQSLSMENQTLEIEPTTS
jgi:hypothetical protein